MAQRQTYQLNGYPHKLSGSLDENSNKQRNGQEGYCNSGGAGESLSSGMGIC